jgi:hypothetical protein
MTACGLEAVLKSTTSQEKAHENEDGGEQLAS